MQLAGTIAVVASVLVLAWQARELTRQSRGANQVSATQAHRELTALLAQVYAVFIEYPELRAYFYDEVTTVPSVADAARLETVAEQYADALQVGLDTAVKLESYGWEISEWTTYVTDMLASSSALRAIVRAHPGWWMPLESIVADYDAQGRAL